MEHMLANAVARFLICALFIWSGLIHKPAHFSKIAETLRAKRYPLPRACLGGAIALELAGSLVILLPRAFVADRVYEAMLFLMAFYTIWTATRFHDFWNRQPQQRGQECASFLKNVALLGAFVLLFERVY